MSEDKSPFDAIFNRLKGKMVKFEELNEKHELALSFQDTKKAALRHAILTGSDGLIEIARQELIEASTAVIDSLIEMGKGVQMMKQQSLKEL